MVVDLARAQQTRLYALLMYVPESWACRRLGPTRGEMIGIPVRGDASSAATNRAVMLLLSPNSFEKRMPTADLLHAARAYLTSDKAWKIVVLPEGFPAPETTKALAP